MNKASDMCRWVDEIAFWLPKNYRKICSKSCENSESLQKRWVISVNFGQLWTPPEACMPNGITNGFCTGGCAARCSGRCGIRGQVGYPMNSQLLRRCEIDISTILNHLVGGLEHFLFSHILGIITPIDFHIFQRGGPTTNQILNHVS